jgi:hypothetical protein
MPGHLIWGVPAAVLIHNIEEALTLPRYAPTVLALVPESIRPSIPSLDYMYVALVVVTAIPVGLAFVVRRGASIIWATYGLLLVAAVMLVNVVWHLSAATLLRGYSPGVVTAVAINLPVMATVLSWARRENWLSSGALSMYIAVGVMLHGAGLLFLVALVSFTR